MSSERHIRVKEIFLAACDQPADERITFLDRACGGDEALRRDVQELLAHDQNPATIMQHGFSEQRLRDRLQDLIEDSADGLDGQAQTSRQPLPARIGQYRILKLLGAGGMGVVYLAEQDNPRRQVALKVIAPSQTTRQSLRRFQHESQILGRLHHPGIAQIFEAGTHDEGHGAQPFFAMELVHGSPLMQAVGDLGLNQRERLELFIDICDAVQHAHQHGVIHRDLKPANILVVDSRDHAAGVGRRLSIKILDFGVARLVDADQQATTLHTGSHQLLGTISYMSPEQLAGGSAGVDTRSDVYALGVVLFELLSGRLPHNVTGKTVPESIRVIAQDEAVTLSSVDRRWRGDLDTIVRKAMERDKARRYESAGDLAADVRRYLVDDPILARPPSTIYQFRKFTRRNKAVVAGVAAVFVVLVVGIVTTSWQARQAIKARDEQIGLRQKADSSAARANAANDFLRRMLSSAQPMVTQGRDVSVREVLDGAALEINAGAYDMPPDVEALVRASLGETYLAIGQVQEARPHIERAVALSREVYGEQSEEFAAALMVRGSLLNAEGDAPAAIAQSEHALAILQVVHPGDHEDISTCLSNMAEYRLNHTDDIEAVEIKTRSLDMLRRLHGESSIEVADARARLAAMLHKPADAEPLLRQAIDTYRKTIGERHPKHIVALRSLAGLLVMRRSYDDAAALYFTALDLGTKVYGEAHPNNLVVLSDLAFCYHIAGQRDNDLRACEQGLRLARQIHADGFMTAQWLMDTGDARVRAGDMVGALADHREAISMAERHGNGAHVLVTVSRLTVASLLIDTSGDIDEAKALAEQVIAWVESTPGARPWMRGQAMSILGEIALRRDDFAEAERLLSTGRELLSGNKLIAHHFRSVTERLVRLYERWNEVAPGTGKDLETAKWRTAMDQLSQ